MRARHEHDPRSWAAGRANLTHAARRESQLPVPGSPAPPARRARAFDAPRPFLDSASMDPLYKPEGVEARWQETWRPRALRGRARRRRADLRHRDPAAERHRRAAHGARAQRVDPGPAHPLPPHARVLDAVAAGIRPRGHRDPERRRARAREGGAEPPRPRPRGVRRADVGVARALRQGHLRAVPQARRLARLPARALHARRGLRARGAEVLRPPVRPRAPVPRQPHRQLVPALRERDLRPRGQPHGRERHALHRPLPARRRLRSRRDRDRPPADDARRRRRGGAPRRRALPRSRRQGGDPSGRRPAHPDHRRRACRARVRHRRREGHARPRPDGLRDRPHARAPGAHRDRARRPHERRSGRVRRARAEEAEKRIVARLEEQDLLESAEPYRHSVGHCDRCGSRIEPLITFSGGAR